MAEILTFSLFFLWFKCLLFPSNWRKHVDLLVWHICLIPHRQLVAGCHFELLVIYGHLNHFNCIFEQVFILQVQNVSQCEACQRTMQRKLDIFWIIYFTDIFKIKYLNSRNNMNKCVDPGYTVFNEGPVDLFVFCVRLWSSKPHVTTPINNLIWNRHGGRLHPQWCLMRLSAAVRTSLRPADGTRGKRMKKFQRHAHAPLVTYSPRFGR